MQVELEVLGTKLKVKASGRIDTTTATDYGSQINDCIEDNNITNVTLDFSQINYISSVGLRVILELQKKMNQIGTMKLINVQPPVMDVFEMTGFKKILTIE